jgi:hypothetical protein
MVRLVVRDRGCLIYKFCQELEGSRTAGSLLLVEYVLLQWLICGQLDTHSYYIKDRDIKNSNISISSI